MLPVRNLIRHIFHHASHTQRVYLDHAASTPVRPEALVATHEAEHLYGNPGGMHHHALAAKDAYEMGRTRIAKVLAVKPQHVLVVSGATEANNLALIGMLRAYVRQYPNHRPHVITTAIEHSSVLHVLESEEVIKIADVTILGVDAEGRVRVQELKAAMRPDTVLVSIGWANGEIGTIQPMRMLVKTIRDYEKSEDFRAQSPSKKIIVHTDAGQAAWAVSSQPHGIDVDMMTLGSGKLYGPHGVAVLYTHPRVVLQSILYGGNQELGMRPGTEVVAPVCGFAVALELLEDGRAQEFTRLTALRKLCIHEMMLCISDAHVNSNSRDTLPHIINISIPGIDSEYIMLALDHAGISISTKSVCVESTGEPVSHVVKALVANESHQAWRASTTLRFSLGRSTTEADVRYAVKKLSHVVAQHLSTRA